MKTMRRLQPRALGVGWALQLSGPGAWARTAVLTPKQDGSMYREDGTFGNGAGQHLFSGRTAFTGSCRALLSFDVAASEPAGATIQSALLQLHVSRCRRPPVLDPSPALRLGGGQYRRAGRGGKRRSR